MIDQYFCRSSTYPNEHLAWRWHARDSSEYKCCHPANMLCDRHNVFQIYFYYTFP